MPAGYRPFHSSDANLLISLPPQFVHVRGQGGLTTLVELVNEELRADRPGRDVILVRPLEVVLDRSASLDQRTCGAPGLLRARR
jgi:hypothetical protein